MGRDEVAVDSVRHHACDAMGPEMPTTSNKIARATKNSSTRRKLTWSTVPRGTIPAPVGCGLGPIL